MMRSVISGVGASLPERVLTNHELEAMVDTTDAWIVSRTGIRERRVASDRVAASDLAVAAARDACAAAELSPADLDAIIVGTVTGDTVTPSTAVLVQHQLGAARCPAFDISAACPGFIYGLEVARSFIYTGSYRNVLVVGVEILSKVLNWEDRSTCVLFGDGAGAAVVRSATDQDGKAGIVDLKIEADGAFADCLAIPAGGSREPASRDSVDRRRHSVTMDGPKVFAFAVRTMVESIRTLFDRNGLSPDDIDLIVPHQANRRILEAVSQRLGISTDRFVINLERYGNTSSASIPIALAEALADGRLKRDSLVVLTSMGAGFCWGSALVRW